MAELAVFASGNGSNFQALAEGLEGSGHRVCCLICDNAEAYALQRARNLNIPAFLFEYKGRTKAEVEQRMIEVLAAQKTKLIALAGFMRVLSPLLIDSFPSRIVNIHPTLLPKYPGAHGIEKSFRSEDKELGITIHYVDYGMDTGPIIMQRRFRRTGDEPLETIEKTIHDLEHRYYPIVIRELLDAI